MAHIGGIHKASQTSGGHEVPVRLCARESVLAAELELSRRRPGPLLFTC